ncbi:MAG: hypothetical protein NTW62_03625 [Candidatus Nomurabacteria bacterium]|nr:hypothetical protein [Candidatus Nomurabacteria bacterium]
MKLFKSKFVSAFLILAVVFFSSGLFVNHAYAASITTFSDTLSNENASAVSNHDISFVTPTGVASGQTIILTFDNSTSINASLDFSDIDVLDNGTNVTLAASPTGATWGAVRTSATVITLTNGTTAVTAGHTIRIKIGTNATNQSTGVRQITNGPAGTTTLAISGTFTDTGTLAMAIISNDVVTVTATVAPTISFALSSNAISFGTLTSANGKWADSSTGQTAIAGNLPTAAHTMTVSTNASSGYVVSELGTTLASGANTIAAATISADSDGTPNSAQFATSFSTSGSSTINTSYARSSNSSWSYANSASVPVVIVTSPAAPVSSEVITASYLANISGSTPAGSYTTGVTYIATATF